MDIEETMELQYIVNLYSSLVSIFSIRVTPHCETCYKCVTDICSVSRTPSRLSVHKEEQAKLVPNSIEYTKDTIIDQYAKLNYHAYLYSQYIRIYISIKIYIISPRNRLL